MKTGHKKQANGHGGPRRASLCNCNACIANWRALSQALGGKAAADRLAEECTEPRESCSGSSR